MDSNLEHWLGAEERQEIVALATGLAGCGANKDDVTEQQCAEFAEALDTLAGACKNTDASAMLYSLFNSAAWASVLEIAGRLTPAVKKTLVRTLCSSQREFVKACDFESTWSVANAQDQEMARGWIVNSITELFLAQNDANDQAKFISDMDLHNDSSHLALSHSPSFSHAFRYRSSGHHDVAPQLV